MASLRVRCTSPGESVYHCMSRTVNKEHLFEPADREMIRRQLGLVAEFCGVQVLTFAIMSNHFHVLAAVPERKAAEQVLTDLELIRRYRLLYPKPTQHRPAQVCVLEQVLAEGGDRAQRLRSSLLARMHEVSAFMQTFKQRVSVWFNGTHKRHGTLWAERFHSTVIEAGYRNALTTVAAYIDLNAVRAGLVVDPKDYRWCGYAEASAGKKRAQEGLLRVLCNGSDASQWELVAPGYRVLLYGKGAQTKPGSAAISTDAADRVFREGGHLALSEALRCRVRAFTDGAVLGSRAYVQEQLAAYRKSNGRRQRSKPQPIRAPGPWGELSSLRGWHAPPDK